MKGGTNTIIGSLMVLAIIALVNVISVGNFKRVDLTQNKEFTVSDATRDVLKGMDDVVNVTCYFSEELPSYLTTLRRDVKDTLDEYRAYSGGKLLVDFKDPAKDPDLENRVRALGIPQVQLDVIQADSRQIQNAYLGIAVSFEDRTEVIPLLSSLQNLEYDLTAAIVKVKKKEDIVIGYLTGHGEPSLFEELDQVRQLLEQQYVVRSVDLDQGRKRVPDDVQTLLIVGPVEISEREKYLIDQYLMSGGRLLIFEDPITLVGGALQARPVRSGLENLLPHYGVKVEENCVLDTACENASFSSGFVRFMVRYPYWPRILSEGFNGSNPVVSKLEALVMPWTSSMSESDQRPDTVEYTDLAKTTDRAWTETGTYNLNPQQEWKPPASTGVYTVVAALTGTFNSYFADRDIPAAPADTTAGALAPADTDEPELIPVSERESQIIVAGTSQLMRPNFLAQFPFNLTFVMNAIDWLSLGDELISIRSREVSLRPLDTAVQADGAAGRRTIIKFFGTYGMAILFGAFGIVRWFVRRREKQEFQMSLNVD